MPRHETSAASSWGADAHSIARRSRQNGGRSAQSDDIQALKAQVDFRALVEETHTIDGGGYVSCPHSSHGDEHPSCHIYDDHFYCYTCKDERNRYGDHLDWLELVHGLSKADAIKELKRRAGVDPEPPRRPRAKAKPKGKRKRGERRSMGTPDKTYDYLDANGELRFQVLRYKTRPDEKKSFRQRRPDGKGGWIWNLKGVDRVLYRLPEVIKAVEIGETVFNSEGEKDCDNLAAHGLTATTCSQGAGKWRDSYSDALKGAHVAILPNNDNPGRKHAEQVAQSLKGKAASVKIVTLPGLEPKGDISDWLDAGHTKDELLELVEGTPEYELPMQKDASSAALPKIITSGRHMRDISADSLEALEKRNTPLRLFMRSGVPSRLNAEGEIEALTKDALKGVMERAANYMKYKSDGKLVPARPPDDVVADIMASTSLSLPKLNSVTHVPQALPNGTILRKNGYDAATGILLRLKGLGNVDVDMPLDQAKRLILHDVLGGFPFVDEGSRARAVAMGIQPFCMPLITGPTPLYLMDAPTPGTGKTLLYMTVAIIALGEKPSVMTYINNSAEMDKRITAMLRQGDTIVIIDNIKKQLNGGELAAALTSRSYTGRELGSSKMLTVANNATWMATGNNVEVSDEIARRIMPIRLDAGVERPEIGRENGFPQPELLDFVTRKRTILVSAYLSIINSWIKAGMPRSDKRVGSFESWSEVLGGILEHIGIESLLEGRDGFTSKADRETAECDLSPRPGTTPLENDPLPQANWPRTSSSPITYCSTCGEGGIAYRLCRELVGLSARGATECLANMSFAALEKMESQKVVHIALKKENVDLKGLKNPR